MVHPFVAKGFAIQYTGLILIVLTVVTGTLLRFPENVQSSPQPLATEVRVIPTKRSVPVLREPHLKGKFALSEVWNEEGELQEDSGALSAFVVLLQRHDLKASLQFSRFSPLNLGRAYSLQRYLKNKGIPENSVAIRLGDKQRAADELHYLLQRETAL